MFHFISSLAGRFKWRLHSPDGHLVSASGWITNLVLDEGLHLLGSGGPDGDLDHFGTIYIGQGNTPVAQTDVALDNRIGDDFYGQRDDGVVSLPNRYNYKSSSQYYSVQGHACRFGPFNKSVNIAEVGLGNQKNEHYHLLTRALIKDTDGQVTTVSVPKGYYFDVFYELWQFYPIDDADYQIRINIDGEEKTYNVKSRLALAGDSGYGGINNKVARFSSSSHEFSGSALIFYNGELRSVDSYPEYSDSQVYPISASENRWTYRRDNMSSSCTVNIGTAYGNVAGGIRSLCVKTTRGAYQLRFGEADTDNPIPKDANKTLSITFSVSWGRYDGELNED